MTKKKKEPKPHFPFEKMPFQLGNKGDENLKDYDMDSKQELDIGESELRKKKHTLRDERNAGHEP